MVGETNNTKIRKDNGHIRFPLSKFPRDRVIDTPSAVVHREARLEGGVLVVLLLAPIVYLSVRHGIHVCLYILALLAVFQLTRNPAPFREGLADPWARRLVIAFASLFVATLVTQVLNQSIHWPSFDGPSKILLAGLVFLFLRNLRIAFAKVLELALPLALLCVFLVIVMSPEPRKVWDGPLAMGRFATSFVDPNSLGSQSLILTMLCVISIGLFAKKRTWLFVLKLIAIAIGGVIVVNAQSRGGWLAIPPLLMLWLALYFSQNTLRGPARFLPPAIVLCAASTLMAIGYETSPILSNRGNFAVENANDWLAGKNLESPIGIRLSIWDVSMTLARESPWIGYGETGLKAVLVTHPLNIPANRSAIDTLLFAGAHSDILAKQLSMGIIGLAAYFATMLVPWLYFWKHRCHAHCDSRAAAHLGLYFITGVFVCGLTNEMLSLKYLCSFFGLMIAGLAADISRRERWRA